MIADFPPPALSKQEYDRRMKAGAKTFEDIDPEFCKWLNDYKGRRKVGLVILFVAIVILAIGTALAIFGISDIV